MPLTSTKSQLHFPSRMSVPSFPKASGQPKQSKKSSCACATPPNTIIHTKITSGNSEAHPLLRRCAASLCCAALLLCCCRAVVLLLSCCCTAAVALLLLCCCVDAVARVLSIYGTAEKSYANWQFFSEWPHQRQ